MNEKLKKVLKIGYNVLKVVTRCLVVALVLFQMLFIDELAYVMNELDIKTDTISEVIKQYIKLVKDKTELPNFEELMKANVVILNLTQQASGSGTNIRIGDKIYIISAGHLDDPTDEMVVKEKNEFRKIRLVKVNHEVDLALFEYVENYYDITIANLTETTPKAGDKIWAIGNPIMIVDAITSGTLVKIDKYFYLIDARIYYGSSGGGLFNIQGELIGVNVAMKSNPLYNLGISVNIQTVKDFLTGKIKNELE